MFFSTLLAYKDLVKTTMGFTPFHLIYNIEAILPIPCEIPMPASAIKLLRKTHILQQRLINLEHIESRMSRLTTKINEKKDSKSHQDVKFSHTFNEGDIVHVFLSQLGYQTRTCKLFPLERSIHIQMMPPQKQIRARFH